MDPVGRIVVSLGSVPPGGGNHPRVGVADPVDCGEGRNKMLLESCNCTFGCVYPVIVGWDKVDVYMVALDMCFNGLGEFIVHYVEHGHIPVGVDVSKNFCERYNHGIIGFGRHGMDKDGIKVVNVHHKHILHVVKGLHREGNGAVGVHHPGAQACQCREAKHLMGGAKFFGGLEVINVRACLEDCRLLRPHGLDTLAVPFYVTLIGGCGWQ
jgi:hypothetical protein